ncbi:MAG: hypothetical protein IKZ28_04955 [Clostridia bacterium]|nr:hypothetical protein [Clostridia bacterium]
MPISKSDFVRALQCEKMLWLDSHAPEHKIIPPEVQARLDAGNEFGDKAMGLFGPFVETTARKEDGRLDFTAMLEKTKTLLSIGEEVICEASFSWYGNFCAADILKKEASGYSLYEVKNTYFARKEFIVDLGFQRLILRKCGVPVSSCKLVLRGDVENCPNADGKPDEQIEGEEFLESGNFLYRIVDVTKAVRQAERLASERIFEYGKLKRKDAEMPNIPVGGQCDAPYRCWYYDFCHKD